MGLLDEAIREHLELKRLHGAAEDELARQEAEALGPVTAEGVSVGAPDEADAMEADQGGAWPFDRAVETELGDESDPPWFDWTVGPSGDVEVPSFVSPEPTIDPPPDPVVADSPTMSFDTLAPEDEDDAGGAGDGLAGEDALAEDLDPDEAALADAGPETVFLPPPAVDPAGRDESLVSEAVEDEPLVAGPLETEPPQAEAPVVEPPGVEPDEAPSASVAPVPEPADADPLADERLGAAHGPTAEPGESEDPLASEVFEPEPDPFGVDQDPLVAESPPPAVGSEPLAAEPEPAGREPEGLAGETLSAEPDPPPHLAESAPGPSDDLDLPPEDDLDLPPEEDPPPLQPDPLAEDQPPVDEVSGPPPVPPAVDPYAPPPEEHGSLAPAFEPVGEPVPTAEQGQPPLGTYDQADGEARAMPGAWSVEDDPPGGAGDIENESTFAVTPIEERSVFEPLPDAEEASEAEPLDEPPPAPEPVEEHAGTPPREPPLSARGFFEETEEHEPLWRDERPGTDPDFES